MLELNRRPDEMYGWNPGMSPGVPHGTDFHFTVSLAETT
jgi:hypothetical protein